MQLVLFFCWDIVILFGVRRPAFILINANGLACSQRLTGYKLTRPTLHVNSQLALKTEFCLRNTLTSLAWLLTTTSTTTIFWPSFTHYPPILRVRTKSHENHNYADHANGRAYESVLRLYACLSSVTLCLVEKRCVLEQNLLLTAHRKSCIWEIDLNQNEWP